MPRNPQRTKPLILCMAHLPPPVHGAKLMGEQVVASEVLRSRFDFRVLPIRGAESIDDIGKIRLGKIFRLIGLAIQLAWRFLEARPDLVYFTMTPVGKGFYRDLLFVGIMKLFGVRRIYHLHAKGVANAITRAKVKGLYDWAFRGAAVILLSPRLYEDISQVVQWEQCYFLPNGISVPWFGGRKVERQIACASEPRILFFSNIFVDKGPFVLLEALFEIREKGIPFRASFAGAWESPSVAAEFGRFVQKAGLQDVVEYLGPRYGVDKDQIFSESDIMAFPTLNDAFPLVVLEAMSNALPVVSTIEGAIPDIVQDNVTGFLVPCNDSKALANCLTILLEDQNLRKQMGEAGRMRYIKYFTKEIFEKNLVDSFERCLSSDNNN